MPWFNFNCKRQPNRHIQSCTGNFTKTKNKTKNKSMHFCFMRSNQNNEYIFWKHSYVSTWEAPPQTIHCCQITSRPAQSLSFSLESKGDLQQLPKDSEIWLGPDLLFFFFTQDSDLTEVTGDSASQTQTKLTSEIWGFYSSSPKQLTLTGSRLPTCKRVDLNCHH